MEILGIIIRENRKGITVNYCAIADDSQMTSEGDVISFERSVSR